MFATRGWRRTGGVLELVLCALLVMAIAFHSLSQMDYLTPSGSPTIRMTDASRTALVARNIVDGNGYTTEDLPAALVDFYDQRGKLHAERWVNADRFPFASYAVAALYAVTRSTSWIVGILVYNVICFVGFLVLLYRCGRALWDDRYAGLLAVTVALMHPYTYMFLYWKDGDMLLLATACMALLYRYFRGPVEQLTWRFSIALGTLLAWQFLSRPNLGAPFVLVFGLVTIGRLWRTARATGVGAAIRSHRSRELLVLLTALAWVVPFVVQSMSAWGQPLFSANNLYQLPLGTRFDMGTDTWWKYTEPGHTPTLGALLRDGTGEIATKFTSSWAATLQNVASSYPMEILLACGLGAWIGRRRSDDPAAPPLDPAAEPPARIVAMIVLFALLANLAVLPLYGYQNYSYRHYMGFGLPLIWLACGRALSLLGAHTLTGGRRAAAHIAAHRAVYVALAVLAMLAVNFGTRKVDANWIFGRTSKLLAVHWLGLLLVVLAVVLRRHVLRPPWFPRFALLAFAFVYACHRPSIDMKRVNLQWRTADDRVWDSLRRRPGIVSSLALQGEVAWNTRRKNIPVPEWPMHVYSFAYDHRLVIEDVYLESAEELVSAGPFVTAAPGFEGYVRLQRWRNLPGYEVAFHSEVNLGYPQFRINPRFKASTDFRLGDPAAITAMRKSPQQIPLSDPREVIYTAHGWGDYYELDGKPVVAATDVTRGRYRLVSERPYEDVATTFFLDEARPSSFDLEFYTATAATYEWFWNLDLYAYDRPADRPAHRIGSYTASGKGWHKVHFEIPRGVTRDGLNKLGFRASTFQPTVLCPETMSDDSCVAEHRRRVSPDPVLPDTPPTVIRSRGLAALAVANVAMFATTVEFHYEKPHTAGAAP